MTKSGRKRLNFAEKYGEVIRSGKKRSTVRLKTRLQPGDIVDIYAGNSYMGTAKIVDIRMKRYGELTEIDARTDGFRDLKELKAALKEHYGYIPQDTFITIIYFSMNRTHQG